MILKLGNFRNPDHKDPPYTPTKLFKVQRIKPIKGNPYWEKEILKSLRLDGKVFYSIES